MDTIHIARVRTALEKFAAEHSDTSDDLFLLAVEAESAFFEIEKALKLGDAYHIAFDLEIQKCRPHDAAPATDEKEA